MAGVSGVERGQAVVAPDFIYDIVVHRTGMGLLFPDSQFGQQFEYSLGLDLQLSSQLVNSNLHTSRSSRFVILAPEHRCVLVRTHKLTCRRALQPVDG